MPERDNRRLTWVFPLSLAKALDRATWTETSAVLSRSGWQITLICAGAPRDEIDDRVRVVVLPRPKFYLLGYALFHVLLVVRLIREFGSTDVILFEEESAPFVLPLAPIRRLWHRSTPKLVMDCRTLPMDTSATRGRLRAKFFRFAHRLANWLADGQTTITRHMVDAAGISTGQLLGIWSSGVDLARFAPAIREREWSSAAGGPLRLIYIGWMGEERNLLSLCQAVQTVAAEGTPVRLAIVGDGPQRAELERFVAGCENPALTVAPPVPYAEVPRLLAVADVGVLPFPDLLKFRVSSFIKMFEYMAAGMPIVATRIVAHTDVLKDGFVFWAPDASPDGLAAAIREACARRDELATMGPRAAVAAHSWTWEASAGRLGAALRRALGEELTS